MYIDIYFRKPTWLMMVYGVIPSPVHTKHHRKDPNGTWKFPTKPWFSIERMGLAVSSWKIL